MIRATAVDRAFRLTMNGRLSDRELIVQGKYDSIDADIPRLLPKQLRRTGDMMLYLLPSGKDMLGIGADEVLIDARRNKVISADARVLLQLGMFLPNIQRRDSITALGTVFLDRNDEPRVLTLTGNFGERVLKLDYYEARFGRNTLFLCEELAKKTS